MNLRTPLDPPLAAGLYNHYGSLKVWCVRGARPVYGERKPSLRPCTELSLCVIFSPGAHSLTDPVNGACRLGVNLLEHGVQLFLTLPAKDSSKCRPKLLDVQPFTARLVCSLHAVIIMTREGRRDIEGGGDMREAEEEEGTEGEEGGRREGGGDRGGRREEGGRREGGGRHERPYGPLTDTLTHVHGISSLA